MKTFGDERIAAGESCITVDLGGCTGMDSTFMGTLAGMATRLSSQAGGGRLQIADTGARNKRSLEDLGLDFLMEIDPPEAIWQRDIEQIRTQLTSPQSLAAPAMIQRTIHVLEAHQTLSAANAKNAETFSTVVTLLEGELNEKHKLAVTPEKK